MQPKLYDSTAAGQYMGGVAEQTLRGWRVTGRGPKFIRVGRLIRYRQADLDDYLTGRTFGSTAQADMAEAA